MHHYATSNGLPDIDVTSGATNKKKLFQSMQSPVSVPVPTTSTLHPSQLVYGVVIDPFDIGQDLRLDQWLGLHAPSTRKHRRVGQRRLIHISSITSLCRVGLQKGESKPESGNTITVIIPQYPHSPLSPHFSFPPSPALASSALLSIRAKDHRVEVF